MTNINIFNSPKKLHTAFGLIEIILSLAIISVVITSLGLLFSLSIQARVKNQVIKEVNGQAEQLLWLMTHTIRNGTSINSPLIATSGTSLSVGTLDPNTNPTIFAVTNGAMTITEGGSDPVTLTNSLVKVSNFIILNNSLLETPGSIRIQFVLEQSDTSGRAEYEFRQTYYASASLRY